MNNDNAIAADSASAEERGVTPYDPTVDHHLQRLQELAAAEDREQRFVLAAGALHEGFGDRVLIVQPDGTHSVVFEPSE